MGYFLVNLLMFENSNKEYLNLCSVDQLLLENGEFCWKAGG